MEHEPARQILPNRRLSLVQKFEWQGRKWLLTVGFDHEGHVKETFIAGSKSGSEINGIIIDACVLLSLLLQMGARPGWIAGRLAVPLAVDGPAPHLELSSLIGEVARQAAMIEREAGPGIALSYATLPTGYRPEVAHE